jgi:type IV pilus assembly protein PilA
MVKKLGLKLKEQKGFTLIELLAVIVILGILAAIAVPAIGNVIDKSRNDATVAEAISIIDAARLATLEVPATAVDNLSTTGFKVEVTNGAITKITWKYDADGTPSLKPLSKYLSKVQATDFTVTYTKATNSYVIADHPAASISGVDVATNGGTAADGILSEEDLAAAAK